MFEGFTQERIRTGGAEIAVRRGGAGPPLLLVHGYPQTHVMWHRIAGRLAERLTVVCADLRGYGDSTKPPSDPVHAPYSKRAMGDDLVEVMAALGHRTFGVAGHDRGGRVVHRMLLDHTGRIERAAVLDIVPTATVLAAVDRHVARDQSHWFFLIQGDGLPEHFIGLDPDRWLESRLFQAGTDRAGFTPEALDAYRRAFRDPAAIHASCEDYRAAAGIDLEQHAADGGRTVDTPLLVLWSGDGFTGRTFDVLAEWRRQFPNAAGHPLPCGHFLAEERPEETLAALLGFFAP